MQELIKKLDEVERFLKNDLPRIAVVHTRNYVADNFRKQGYQNGGFTAWANRRFETREGGAILIGKQSGGLRDSIAVSISSGAIRVESPKAYAKIHNEGGIINQNITPRQRRFFWAKHIEAKDRGDTNTANRWKAMALSDALSIDMPRRQFMPKNGEAIPPELEAEIAKSIEKKLVSLF